MPSKTPKQVRTMAAAAHDPAFAKRMGIPQSVAKDFNKADSAARPKAGDMAAMRSPMGHTAGKAGPATFKPTKSDEREKPVGRKGMTSGKY